ncbi:MAG: Prepilin-type N-terminal cleavage/methylation protein, partial [Actinomycetota bacterium]|nr:Prepilin-type N-terminal cleavage/methylation protein [Actinomycetota bacterium]
TPPGDTTTVPINPMQRDDCTVQITSHAYSTEISGSTGRSVAIGGSTSTGGGTTVAEWRWLAPVITEFSGDAKLVFAYQCASGSTTFQVAIGDWNQTAASGNYTSRATTTASVSCTGTWRTAEVNLSVPKFSVRSKNGSGAVPTYLVVRIAAPSGAQVRLDYDSAASPSTLFIGTKP